MMLDKLSDIFLLQVLRYVLKNGLLSQGIFAGLTHPQLAVVVNAINAEPEKQWSVERLAELAAMSRSKFASVFKETIGQPPNDYITDLRVSIAQNMLKLDKPVSLIANEVGYEHGSALARVFRKKLGLSPKEWLQKIKVK
jgi:transcriptional regulator GlxA family with amidase domain